jgi:hypothetical protein
MLQDSAGPSPLSKEGPTAGAFFEAQTALFRGKPGRKMGFPRGKTAEIAVFRGKTAISLL